MSPAASAPGGAPPEFALLLACAASEGEAAGASRIRLALDARLDWRRVVELADRHGLVPALRRGLAAADPRVPGDVRALLGAEARRIAHRNLELAAELVRLLGLLGAHDVPALAYKGPALAVMAYGSVARRPFVDLDVLVPRARVGAARDLLVADGYRAELRLPPRGEAAHFRTGYDLAFRRDGDAALVELHWALAPRYFAVPFDFAALHARAEPVALPGGTVPALAPGDLVPALCVHGARHLWGRLEWVAAVAALLRRHPGLDWQALVGHAGRAGLERILLVGLGLAGDLFGLRLPAPVAARARRHPTLGALVGAFRERLERGELGLPGVWETVRLHLGLRERLRDRVRYGVGGALSSSARDWAARRPPALGPLRRLARPLRLVRDYGWRRPGA